MQRAIQNTQAATRRRSRPLRVAGSTLTANVAFAVLKYAALTAAGVLLFRWGQGYALAAAESAGQFKVDPETGAIIEPESEAGDDD